MEVSLANRDGWFFTAIAGGATVLAVPLLVWLKGDIAQDEPLGVGAVMLGSSAVACFLYAALKFLCAVRQFHQPSFLPMLLTAGLGLTGLFVAMSHHFRSHAIKAGALAVLLAVLLAVVLVCIVVLPFRKYIQSRLRLALLLMTLVALPVFLLAAAVIELRFHVKGSRGYMASSQEMVFPEFIPLQARRSVIRLVEYLVPGADEYAIETCWLSLDDLKAIALDPADPHSLDAWSALKSSNRRTALEVALSVPTVSPRTIPASTFDESAGHFIGQVATDEVVRARLAGAYSLAHQSGVLYGLDASQRHRKFLPEIAAQIETTQTQHAYYLWHMLREETEFRNALLRKHLQSTTPQSRGLIALAAHLCFEELSDDVVELALQSDEPRIRALAFNSAFTYQIINGRNLRRFVFKKAHWRLVLKVISGEAPDTNDEERAGAAMQLQCFKIETSARRLLGMGNAFEAELKRVLREARPLIEDLKE